VSPEGVVLELSARLVGLACALQALELLALRPAWGPDGVFSYAVLRDDLRALPGPLRPLLARLLDAPGFGRVLQLRLVAALVALGTAHPSALPVLLVTHVLVSLRWRGAFNGGSDAMTLVVLLGLVVASAAPDEPLVTRGALLYIALQAALSYFIAGVVKLKGARWRSGAVLSEIAAAERYQAPALARALLARPAVARAAAWAVMLFDTAFPLALTGPRLALVFIAAALGFHLLNAWLFGLNRFLLAWASAWPAVAYAAVLFGGA
jgi:hypothetical protein